MPSTFLGLTIATSGLYTYQAALNTTGNNISNVETPGYSRQQIVQQAGDALRAYTTYGQIGTGVVTTDITQLRSEFYDKQYRDSATGFGEFFTKNYYMKQLENLFHEDKDTKGYIDAFNTFFNSLDSASTHANDVTYLTQFVNDAQKFADYFNQISTGLTNMQDDLNEEVKSLTDRVNSIAQQIYALNKQINVSELAGGNANAIRDERALLVDELSTIVPIEVTETAITSSQGFVSKATDYTITICGQTLVDNNSYNQLQCTARENKVNQSDVKGLYEVTWSNGMAFGVTSSDVGGKLKAVLDLRDGNNANNFKGKIKDIDYVSSTSTKVTISSSVYDNLNQMSLNEKGEIKLGTRSYKYDGFSAQLNETTGEYEYTFNIVSNNSQIDNSFKGREASVGSPVDYCGIPYYMSQINEFARTFAETVNNILTGGFTEGGNVGSILFTGTNASGKEYDFALSGIVSEIDSAAKTVTVKANEDETALPDDEGNVKINGVSYKYSSYTYNAANNTYTYNIDGEMPENTNVGKGADVYSLVRTDTSDTYYQLTAGNLKVADKMLKKPLEYLGTTSDYQNAADSGDILKELYSIQADTKKLSFRGGTANQFLTSIISDMSVDAGKAKSFAEKYDSLVKIVDNQRLSVSGVDNDEEGVNLMKYQNAYDLSCQLVKVMQEIYDKLINGTGV